MKLYNSKIYKYLRILKVLRGRDFYHSIDIGCPKLTFGNPGANWTICPDGLNNNSIVYSFGVGYDISFDLVLIKKFGLKTYAFDPTEKSIRWLKKQNLPKNFQFCDFGLASFDGEASFAIPNNPNFVSAQIISDNQKTGAAKKNYAVKKLSTIMNQLGHNHIDILKMDIEGAEYDVIEDVLSSDIDIKQWLIEFHHRFNNIGIKKTKQAISLLNTNGYKIFSISSTGEEYSFIKQVE